MVRSILDHVLVSADVLWHDSFQVVNLHSDVVLLSVIEESHVAAWVLHVIILSVHDVGHQLHQNGVTSLGSSLSVKHVINQKLECLTCLFIG